MALIDDVKVAYKAVVRADLNDTVAAAVATSITNGTTTLDAYIASLVSQNTTTTGASVAIAAFVTGKAPTSAKLDDLKKAADAQVASYTAMKVANPALGAFEAFGKGFAEDASTGFGTKYGALSTADFINTVYASVMGELPSAGAFANLSSQIDFFTKLYTDAKLANPALLAKGAVLGQIVGYAFIDPTFSAKATLDNQVAAVLTAAAKGDATVYDKALPAVQNPGQVGVTITLANAAETVSTAAADPAFKSTALNDTIQGVLGNGQKLDGGGGADVLDVTTAGANNTTTSTSIETVKFGATAAATVVDMKNFSGVTSVTAKATTNNAWDLTVNNINAGATLTVDGAIAANTFQFAAATTASADLILKSVGGGAIAIGQGANKVTTLNIDVGSTNSTVGGLTLNGVTETVNVKGSGELKLGAVADADLKTFNASGLTGRLSVDLAAVKEGSTFTLTGADDSLGLNLTGGFNSTVALGAGKDSVTVALAQFTNVTLDGTKLKTSSNFSDSVAGTDKLKIDLAAVGDLVAFDNTKLIGAASLEAALNIVADDAATNANGKVAVFEYQSNTYVFREATDGAAGFGAGDGLIKLAGVGYSVSSTGDATKDISAF